MKSTLTVMGQPPVQRLGEPAGNRFLLNWYDETPRNQMRAELLAEVKRALAKRRDGAA